MPTTLILGGAGKLARQLTSQLLAQDPPHTIHSVIRPNGSDPSQADDLRRMGAHPILLSLEDASASELASAIGSADPKPDVVVWCAGAPFREPQRVDPVDRVAAIKAMDACAEAGVRRFVSVSMLDLRDRENRPVPEWYTPADVEGSNRIWGGVMATWARAKFAADSELCRGNERRRLDFTIVRPGGLSEGPGRGTVAAGRVPGCLSDPGKRMVTRADVAAVIAECIRDSATVGLAFDVLGGGEPVAAAVARVVRDKEDTFQGYY